MQSSEPQSLLLSRNQHGVVQLNRSVPKKIKRKIISKKPSYALTTDEKKREMKSVYTTPVIQHTLTTRPIAVNQNNNNNHSIQPIVVKSIARSASTDQKMIPKGYVEKKRVLITSQYDSQQQQQKLGLSKSAPNMRPVSGGPSSISSAIKSDNSNANNANNANNNNNNKTTGNINPYTQRSLNPGILF